ncbi:MAG: hypothetical protein ACM3NH_01835 [Candidatus Saccharibacteria bacterium]
MTLLLLLTGLAYVTRRRHPDVPDWASFKAGYDSLKPALGAARPRPNRLKLPHRSEVLWRLKRAAA